MKRSTQAILAALLALAALCTMGGLHDAVGFLTLAPLVFGIILPSNSAFGQIVGGPGPTVGPAGSTYPVSQYANDIGAAINAAGLASKNATGANVYLVGPGIGTTYTITTPIIWYNTVNYFGDGLTLKAAAGVANPSATDSVNVYFSGIIQGFSVDGNSVAGTFGFNMISMQKSTLIDIIVQNCGVGVSVPTPSSPTMYTNAGSFPTVVQVVGGTISAVTANGVASQPTDFVEVYTIGAGNSLVVTWTGAPTITVSAVGFNMFSSSTITQHDAIAGRTCSSNSFLECYAGTCQTGLSLCGQTTPTPVTNNTWVNFIQDNSAICAINFGAAADSNTWLEAKLQINANAAIGIALQTWTPSNDQATHWNRFYAVSIDTTNSTSQIGILQNKNTFKPNFAHNYEPGSAIPTTVQFGGTTGYRGLFRDRTTPKTYIQGVGARRGNLWVAEAYPGNNTAFTNNDFFSMYLTIQGGTITSITLNGTVLGVTSGTFLLKPGDTITCASSVNPTTYSSLLMAE